MPSIESIDAPVEGEVIQLSEVKDEVFSSGTMGEGFAVKPANGKIVAPCDAEVIAVFETGHAIGLTTMAGAEVLIHVGIDTVMLKVQGFDTKVKAGDLVKKGDLLMDVDMDAVQKAGYDTTVMVIVTDPHNVDVSMPVLA
ncbi:PTS glucose transporter subunit IIA [Ligilactobacillus sp. WC1T17]|uniref:PTS sugar transporter subunit IIA n=1 Tax=Ligilactobacillus sp. WC1T17 TaxID=3158786 RepID=UPI00094C85DB